MNTAEELRAKAHNERAAAERAPVEKVALLCLALAESFERLAERREQSGGASR